MIVVVSNYDTKKELMRFETKEENLGNIIKDIEKKQESKDILGLGKTFKCDKPNGFGFGILSTHSKGGENYSYDYWANKDIPNFLVVDGEKLDVRLAFHMYRDGLILYVGKSATSFFGTLNKMYFKKFTSKSVKLTAIEYAKTFKNPKSMMKYIKDNEDLFKYLVINAGYQYSTEYATKPYEESLKLMPDDKKKKFEKDLHELNEYLENLNKTEGEKEEREIPAIITEDVMIKEAVARMKDLQMFDEAINSFKNNRTIMMSDGNGIIYGLDPNAQSAVKEVMDYNLMPYHVIHQLTNFGEIYTVLSVSKNSEEWEYERADTSGYLDAYAYNATSVEFSEFGSVRIYPCNGGLIRTE